MTFHPMVLVMKNMKKWHAILLVTVLASANCAPYANAMGAGDYYYFISNRCQPLGPVDDEVALDAITPDVKLFEVAPAGISDYAVYMNTNALSNYTDEGRARLRQLEAQQAYTAGANPSNPNQVFHDFMLQREAITLSQLTATLNRFSQGQTQKGYFYRKLLGINDKHATFKAITRVRLLEMDDRGNLFILYYKSEYYQLDKQGSPIEPVFISVDHRAALTANLHPHHDKWQRSTIDGVCAHPFSQ